MKKWTIFSVLSGFVFIANIGLFWSSENQVLALEIEKLTGKTKLIVEAAKSQVGKTLIYDPSYQKLNYPNGDLPVVRGVCTDVVIRSLRAVDIDLQKQVHLDMKNHFNLYPKIWGLKKTDKNIDHRRVPNLRIYFKRLGWSLKVTESSIFLPSDIVTWTLLNGREHIGIVSDERRNDRLLIVHNIGSGTVSEDVLYDWKITGHFRRN